MATETAVDKKSGLRSNGLSLRQLRMRITMDDPIYPGLKKIKLKGKELSVLPANLFNLTELQVLDLSPEREACLFYHLVRIPPEIANLGNLTVLAIDTNKLTTLPEELCALYSLERLALSNNQLTCLPGSFPSLTNLRSLYCSNNKFDSLPRTVCQLKSLAFMDFSDNFITSIPQGNNYSGLLKLFCLENSHVIKGFVWEKAGYLKYDNTLEYLFRNWIIMIIIIEVFNNIIVVASEVL